MIQNKLVDSFGRHHSDLRISVTDRCNIRCFYCMPNENVRFQPRKELLTFEEMTRFTRILAGQGIKKIRLTGGEPLVRSDLPDLVAMLSEIPGISDIAMTTNGLLLGPLAEKLKTAGLNRLNVSLDAVDRETFELIARRPGLQKVLDGLRQAKLAGFTKIRINALAIKDINEHQVIPLARFAREENLELRFIEFMPLDAEKNWDVEKVLSGTELRRRLESEFGPMIPVDRANSSQPAVDFRYADGQGSVGFINSVTEPFCGTCNRLRITADGKLRNCLFATDEWDVRALIRGDATDQQIADFVIDCVQNKKPGHLINQQNFVQPQRAMYQIGG
jgi:GTP 3',8-cyclase